MSVDTVNRKEKDITWTKLISDAAREIKECRDRANRLSKSISFFKKQESLGAEFPRLDNKT